jgi:YVTN family beta-propeller protein
VQCRILAAVLLDGCQQPPEHALGDGDVERLDQVSGQAPNPIAEHRDEKVVQRRVCPAKGGKGIDAHRHGLQRFESDDGGRTVPGSTVQDRHLAERAPRTHDGQRCRITVFRRYPDRGSTSYYEMECVAKVAFVEDDLVAAISLSSSVFNEDAPHFVGKIGERGPVHIRSPPQSLRRANRRSRAMPSKPPIVRTAWPPPLTEAETGTVENGDEEHRTSADSLRAAPVPAGHRPSARPVSVRTFLVADVRGYTAFTSRLGDAAGAELVSRMADILRATAAEHDGRVIDVTGDSALTAFRTPGAAIACAVDLQLRFLNSTRADPTHPLTVGIALEIGEAVHLGDGFRGTSVNIASRLCALAAAGEILATKEVTHLAHRVEGVRFEGQRRIRVKGIPRDVDVVHVVAADIDTATEMARLKPRLEGRTPRLLGKRRWAVAAVAALGLLVASSAAVFTGRSSPGPRSAVQNLSMAQSSIAVVDPKTRSVRSVFPLGFSPSAVTSGGGAIWATDVNGGTVARIDPTSGKVTKTIPVGSRPVAVAFGRDAIWVANSGDGTVSHVDVRKDTVRRVIPVGDHPTALALTARTLWVVVRGADVVRRFSTGTGEPIGQPLRVGHDPGGVAVGLDNVWVTNAGDNTVSRLSV